jgi:DNA-binding IclR family transcriptional regulator
MRRKSDDLSNQSDCRYCIRVLDRGFRILSLLSDGKPRTQMELSEGINLSPSTTFRLLATLSYSRYIKRNEQTNQYSLGLACLELSRAYADGNDLRGTALPELEALRDDIKETVHLGVLDQTEVVYLEKIPGLHAIGLMGSRVGGRSPSYCTGVGKVLLAQENNIYLVEYFQKHKMQRFTDTTIISFEALQEELKQVRRQGYAVDRGEHEVEVWCVAAPIFDMIGDAVAALSISGPAGRMAPLEENCALVQKAKKTARTISIKLGFSPDR